MQNTILQPRRPLWCATHDSDALLQLTCGGGEGCCRAEAAAAVGRCNPPPSLTSTAVLVRAQAASGCPFGGRRAQVRCSCSGTPCSHCSRCSGALESCSWHNHTHWQLCNGGTPRRPIGGRSSRALSPRLAWRSESVSASEATHVALQISPWAFSHM